MLVEPDDRVRTVAGDRARGSQAIASKHDRKPPVIAGRTNSCRDRRADGKAGRDLALLRIADLADILTTTSWPCARR